MARDTGLRTSRRISHVFVMDTPAYARTLLITDAAINIEPELEDKVHIVQNAIDLAHALGIPEPKVALLSAIETVNPKIKSTLDAAALCKMADRGQITGGILDGPLAFDTAVSVKAADIKNLVSPVTGQADILVVPDLESGNMEHGTPITFPEDENFDIGQDTRTGVAMIEYRYECPFKFTGKINKVTFELGPELLTEEDHKNLPEIAHAVALAKD